MEAFSCLGFGLGEAPRKRQAQTLWWDLTPTSTDPHLDLMTLEIFLNLNNPQILWFYVPLNVVRPKNSKNCHQHLRVLNSTPTQPPETFGRSHLCSCGHQKSDKRRGFCSPGEVQVGLAGHGDVGQVLLQDEDVPAHLLDAGLADALEVVGAVDEDAGDEVAQTCKREEIECQ